MGNQLIINFGDQRDSEAQVVDEEFLSDGLQKAALFLEIPCGFVDVTFIDEEYSRRLNQDYRGVDSPATVLSFHQMELSEPLNFRYDLSDPEQPPPVLGDIVLCTSAIEKKYPDNELNTAVLRMAVHGLLHLCGFTHDDDEDFEVMDRIETRILHLLQIDFK